MRFDCRYVSKQMLSASVFLAIILLAHALASLKYICAHDVSASFIHCRTLVLQITTTNSRYKPDSYRRQDVAH